MYFTRKSSFAEYINRSKSRKNTTVNYLWITYVPKNINEAIKNMSFLMNYNLLSTIILLIMKNEVYRGNQKMLDFDGLYHLPTGNIFHDNKRRKDTFFFQISLFLLFHTLRISKNENTIGFQVTCFFEGVSIFMGWYFKYN